MKQLDTENKMKNQEEVSQEPKRRQFLKKAVYSAPVLLALGQLAKPTKAEADSGPPDGPPGWGGWILMRQIKSF